MSNVVSIARGTGTAPQSISKDEALRAISGDVSTLRDLAKALADLTDTVCKSVANGADVNLSHVDNAESVINMLDSAKAAAKRIHKVSVARCKARLK